MPVIAFTDGEILSLLTSFVLHMHSGGGGGRKGHALRVALCRGRHFRRGEIWNSEIWPVLHGALAFALQTVGNILQPLTLPQFWDHTRNCQCSTTYTKQCVCDEYE